ncbi:MAG TPA: hypothetical protein VKY57_03935, partial [Chitinispirillaceae bacterium]|nr:hypothetical protein [Chitinispirillaceae bacterium]
VKAKILICAMLDHSLSHNSPLPKSIEASQGIFTNYIQFMDNVPRNWGTIRTSEKGLQRLKKIHEKVLQWNKEPVIDPVYVKNYGTVLDYDTAEQKRKRKNYAFYEGYTRLYYECEFLDYSVSENCGAGVLFNKSDNIKLYIANGTDSLNMFTDAIIEGHHRIIIPANDTAKFNRFKESGLWVMGNIAGDTSKQVYYTGIHSVRLPIQYTTGVIKPINTEFSLAEEKSTLRDITGTLVSGYGANLFKIFTLKQEDGKEKIYEDKNNSAVIQNEKKLITIDSAYFDKMNIVTEFKAQGTEAEINRLTINKRNQYSAELESNGPGGSTVQLRVKKLLNGNMEPVIVIDKYISTGDLFLAFGQINSFDTIVGYSYELLLTPPEDLGNFWGEDKEEYVLEVTDGIKLFVSNSSPDTKTQILPDITGTYGEKGSNSIVLTRSCYVSDILSKGKGYIIAEAGGENSLTVMVREKSDGETGIVQTRAEKILVSTVWKNVIAEPVSNRNADNFAVVSPPVENPSGLGTKDYSVFRIDVKGADPSFSGEKIIWRSDHVLWVDIQNEYEYGKEGRIKSRSNRTGVDNLLKVMLPGDQGAIPEFQISHLWEKEVKITFYVGYDADGNKILTDDDLKQILGTVNEIYKQVAMKFVRHDIDPGKVGAINDSLKIDYYREISDTTDFYNLVDLDGGTGGVEVYFVQSLYNNTNGVNSKRGAAVAVYRGTSKKPLVSIARTAAHELGHATGLEDIYDIAKDGTSISGDILPSGALLPMDCNLDACFYDTTKATYSYYNILRKLLMYGYAVAGDSELEKYDIPRGKVFGVGKKSGQEGYEIKMNDVGLEDMFVVRNGKLYYRDPVHE